MCQAEVIASGGQVQGWLGLHTLTHGKGEAGHILESSPPDHVGRGQGAGLEPQLGAGSGDKWVPGGAKAWGRGGGWIWGQRAMGREGTPGVGKIKEKGSSWQRPGEESGARRGSERRQEEWGLGQAWGRGPQWPPSPSGGHGGCRAVGLTGDDGQFGPIDGLPRLAALCPCVQSDLAEIRSLVLFPQVSDPEGTILGPLGPGQLNPVLVVVMGQRQRPVVKVLPVEVCQSPAYIHPGLLG